MLKRSALLIATCHGKRNFLLNLRLNLGHDRLCGDEAHPPYSYKDKGKVTHVCADWTKITFAATDLNEKCKTIGDWNSYSACMGYSISDIISQLKNVAAVPDSSYKGFVQILSAKKTLTVQCQHSAGQSLAIDYIVKPGEAVALRQEEIVGSAVSEFCRNRFYDVWQIRPTFSKFSKLTTPQSPSNDRVSVAPSSDSRQAILSNQSASRPSESSDPKPQSLDRTPSGAGSVGQSEDDSAAHATRTSSNSELIPQSSDQSSDAETSVTGGRLAESSEEAPESSQITARGEQEAEQQASSSPAAVSPSDTPITQAAANSSSLAARESPDIQLSTETRVGSQPGPHGISEAATIAEPNESDANSSEIQSLSLGQSSVTNRTSNRSQATKSEGLRGSKYGLTEVRLRSSIPSDGWVITPIYERKN